VVGNPEGNRPLGKPRHGREYNIKVDLGKMRSGMNLINLTHERDE
jgi:hypothetical protein